MPQNWQEYLEEKRKLADRQFEASNQKTPASRLVWYYSATFPAWRVQIDEVRKLDEIFENNDFNGINNYIGWSYNYLLRSVGDNMKDEIALRLAVENGELPASEYKPAWWVK